MRRTLYFAAPLMILCCAIIVRSAQAQNVSIEPSMDRIEITTGFDGADISVFGVAEQKAETMDLALVIKGPARRMVVRKKDEILGAWVNRHSIDFAAVPAFYDYALSRPDLTNDAPDVFNDKAIGLNTLDFEVDDEGRSAEYYAAFREALIRNKQGEGLFPLKAKDITFMEKGFFKVAFHVPSNVPTGHYTIEAYLVDQGKVSTTDVSGFDVVQVGFSAKIFHFAHSRALPYGLTAIAIAFLAGWGAFTFLRRD